MKKAQEFNASDDAIRHAHTEHYIQSWSVQGAAEPLVIAGGKGCWFWDTAGKRYLDFESQLVNLTWVFNTPTLLKRLKNRRKNCVISALAWPMTLAVNWRHEWPK